MEQLPADAAILLSWLNMKLRDEYSSPEALCRDLDIDTADFEAYIAARGISYFPEGGRCVLN